MQFKIHDRTIGHVPADKAAGIGNRPFLAGRAGLDAFARHRTPVFAGAGQR